MAQGPERGPTRSGGLASTTARGCGSPRRHCISRSRSRTTSTSTRRSSTRRTSGGSSAPTRARCRRTGGGSRSATTAGPEAWLSPAPTSSARAGSARGRRRHRYAPSPPPRPRARARLRRRRAEPVASRPRGRRSPSTCSASCSSTTGARATSRPGSTVPLGPFLGKSFLTSISAWVTPLALLDEHRVAAPAQDPPPLRYLAEGRRLGARHRARGRAQRRVVSRGNARTLYWTMPQQLAHATSNGASLRTGDLMASGTISGPDRGSEGSLIELTRNGAEPLQPPGRGGADVSRGRGRGRPPGERRDARARRGARPGHRSRLTRGPLIPFSYRGDPPLLARPRNGECRQWRASFSDPDVWRLLVVRPDRLGHEAIVLEGGVSTSPSARLVA